jgi:hypothetical protein
MISLLLLLAGQIEAAAVESVREVIPAGKTHIVHIRDWHFVSREDFAADTGLADEKLDEAYAEHLELVQKIQASQREALAGVKKVHVEGLAPGDMVVLAAMIRLQRKSPDHTTGLKLGAAGQLMVEKKLNVLPAEADGFERANPVQEGEVKIDLEAQEQREDAIVRNLLKRPGKVYLVLGGAHDLADNIRRLSPDCGYTVVTPKGYPR